MINIVKQILRVFEQNNLWKDGIELIGSWCFWIYQKQLGAKNFPLRTLDIDFLVPLPFKRKSNIDIVEELGKLGFQYSFNPDGSIYLWNTELKIEFIVPERGKGFDHALEIKQLSIKAVPLRFVDILLSNPIYLKIDEIEVSVPDPASFCLHKILIAGRRKKEENKIKDLEQGILSFEIAEREKIKNIFKDLPKGWKRNIQRNLQNALEIFPLLKKEIEEINFTLQYF